MLFKFLFCFALCLSPCAVAVAAQQSIIRVAVLDLGNTSTGKSTAQLLWTNLRSTNFSVLDRDLTRAAAQGSGYQGSLNLSRTEARDLGSALGCEYYVLGDAQIIRRSPSSGESHFEAYASIFVVSARTGNLVTWSRPSFSSSAPSNAERQLASELNGNAFVQMVIMAIQRAQEDEVRQRLTIDTPKEVIEEAPTDEATTNAQGVRLPQPFRRLKPAYPTEAATADAEATVDVLVEVDEKGDVKHAEVERWAGFGLDQASLDVVRQLRFFPAMRDGKPISMRVLLRYNFRKPVRTT